MTTKQEKEDGINEALTHRLQEEKLMDLVKESNGNGKPNTQQIYSSANTRVHTTTQPQSLDGESTHQGTMRFQKKKPGKRPRAQNGYEMIGEWP